MISGKKIHMTHEKNRIKKKAMWKKKLTQSIPVPPTKKLPTPYSRASLINEHTMLNVLGPDKKKSNVGECR